MIAIRYLKRMILSVIILLLGMGCAVYFSEKSCIIRKNKQLSESVLRHVALNLKIRMEDQIVHAQIFSDEAIITDAYAVSENSDNMLIVRNYLKKLLKLYPFYEHIFIIETAKSNPKEKVIAESSDTPQTYPMPQKISDGKEISISEIFPSPYSKVPVFILSAPVRKDGKISGSFNIVIKFNDISDMIIKEVNIGEIFFADADKVRNENLSEKFMIQQIDLSSLGMTQEWYVGIVPKNDQVQHEMRSFLKILIITGISFFIAWGITVFVITNFLLVKPIRKASEIARRLADYDFIIDIDTDRKDEIGQMFKDLKLTADRFRETMTMMSEITLKLTSSINDISCELNDQASIASEQSASVSQITATMAQLSSSFTQIAEHSDIVAKIAEQSLQNTKEGADAVKNVMAKMEEIHRDNQKNIGQIIELGKKSKEISKVMEIINTITDRTKLIAFNAALEASSAGESGKRFGVVAMEIRRLADNVMESTDDIEGKINEIKTAVENMIIASEKGSQGIHKGLEYSTQTAAKLTDIVKGSQSTVDAAKQISLSTQQQKIASEQVLIALREIDKGAEQGSLSIGHISSISKILSELVEKLRQLTDKFVLKG